MKYELTLSIPCPSNLTAQVIVKSLYPEMQQRIPKTNIQLISENAQVLLTISANDVSSIRAASNSYIRWIETAAKVHQLV
jgi:tRNA threonylcarbamoyladenosine modification (KEOPS) complex  Pcc1 subunit